MKKIFIAFLLSLFSSTVFAGSHSPCGVKDGSISILANEFTTYRIFMDEVKSCAGPDAEFNVTHTVDHNKLQVAALSANPSEFAAKLVTNGSITPLMNDGLLRPLDDLVAKYREKKPKLAPRSIKSQSPSKLRVSSSSVVSFSKSPRRTLKPTLNDKYL